MTERERRDFLSGDKNNDHFYKRSNTNPPADHPPIKKTKFENASPSNSFPQLTYKTGKKSCVFVACHVGIRNTFEQGVDNTCRDIIG